MRSKRCPFCGYWMHEIGRIVIVDGEDRWDALAERWVCSGPKHHMIFVVEDSDDLLDAEDEANEEAWADAVEENDAHPELQP